MHKDSSPGDAPTGSSVTTPPNWKLAIVNFIGLYPLILFIPQFFDAVVGPTPLWLSTIVTLSIIIATMTWLVMPFLTRLFKRWLYQM